MSLPALLTITVTEEDIAQGLPRDPCCCPTAIAVRRTLGLWIFVYVATDYVHLHELDQSYRILHQTEYTLPLALQQQIARYDRHDGFTPGVYTLTKQEGE